MLWLLRAAFAGLLASNTPCQELDELHAACSARRALLDVDGADRRRTLYFDHVPKTGGSALALHGCAPASAAAFKAARRGAAETAAAGTWRAMRARLEALDKEMTSLRHHVALGRTGTRFARWRVLVSAMQRRRAEV